MSKIEWTDETWNPITGCTPCSQGCDNCYAKRMANRLRGRYGYPADDPFRVTYHSGHVLMKPYHWKKPRMVFVCSMGDLFHRDIDVDSQAYPAIFRTIARTQQHTYQILTKRPKKMSWVFENIVKEVPKNAWIGVTVCNQQEADEKIPILLQIPAVVRWVSVEPMLGQIDLAEWLYMDGPGYLDLIQWVVCGGETGPGARPMHPDWARSLRDQCQCAGVPYFFKQWGNWSESSVPEPKIQKQSHKGMWLMPDGSSCGLFDFESDGAVWMEPGNKKKAGRLLDGRIWQEYPKL